MYPRDILVGLWQLTTRFHRECLPNYLKLTQTAALLLAHMKRGLSCPNKICVLKCNRLYVQTQNMLLKVQTESRKDRTPDFQFLHSDSRSEIEVEERERHLLCIFKDSSVKLGENKALHCSMNVS